MNLDALRQLTRALDDSAVPESVNAFRRAVAHDLGNGASVARLEADALRRTAERLLQAGPTGDPTALLQEVDAAVELLRQLSVDLGEIAALVRPAAATAPE